MSNLQIRLRNCIQTILDLEPAIGPRNGRCFEEEFVSLKHYLGRVDNMELAEDDVLQLEKATSEFLAEIKGIYSRDSAQKRILQ